MKVVIVGGVAGGASAAARLRRLDESADIVMIERTGYVSYANCGLPYFVGGEITDRKRLTLQTPDSFLSRFNVDVRVNSEVIAIDRPGKMVRVCNLVDGSEYDESYDRLILSPGARPIIPDMPRMDDSRVMTLRTVEDTLRMHGFIQSNAPKRAVVCGGGYIGLEIADNLHALGIEVTIVQRPDHVLPQVDREMAADVHHHIRSKGVDLRLSDAVVGFDTDGPLTVLLRSGERIETDMSVVALGVSPDTQLAKDAGLDLGIKGSIVVDEHLRTSDPDIYAVGDAIQVKNAITGAYANIALAGPANKQGRIVANNIVGIDSTYEGSMGPSVLRVFDMTVGATGLTEKQAKDAGYDVEKVYTYSASHATYYPGAKNMSVKTIFDRSSGKILGAQIVGYGGVDKRIDVIATAIRAGMTVYDLEELELSYAPPYSSAKDPVNYAGFVATNLLSGLVKQYHWDELDARVSDPNMTVVDLRTSAEYAEQHLDGVLHIPVDELRERLSEIPKNKPVSVFCHSGLRSYLGCRILMQNGYDCSHMAGGFRFYASVVKDLNIGSPEDYPCGIKRS